MAAKQFLRDGIVRWIETNHGMVPLHDAARAANRAARAVTMIQRYGLSSIHVGKICASGKILESDQLPPRRNDYITHDIYVVATRPEEHSDKAGLLFRASRIYLIMPYKIVLTGIKNDDRKRAQGSVNECSRLCLI
jgi:hypothetical protein